MTWDARPPAENNASNATNYAPQAGQYAVWPPPVYQQTQPLVFHKASFPYERSDGSVSDVREGSVAIDQGASSWMPSCCRERRFISRS